MDAAAKRPGGETLRALLEKELDQLATTLEKIDQQIVRIAVFGLVSRGKSAVLNAIVGENRAATGPLNGVTRQVNVLKWSPTDAADMTAIAVELMDTPGLDEVEGEARAVMAADVATQCDLILFVVAGEITRVEYEALCELRVAQKPLILVFNKVDLYPNQSRAQVYQDLLELSSQSMRDSQLQQLLSEDEVALVAADPKPEQVRVERADGEVEYLWEKPPVQIAALQQRLLKLLKQEGRSLLALNALTQSRRAEKVMAEAIIASRAVEAEALIWRFTRYKAITVGLNPFGFLDFVGGAIADLTLIRELSKLYGLPMTRYEAGNLLKTILISSGVLLGSELFGLVLGVGKGFSALVDGGNLAVFTGVGLVQAGAAGYGAYSVGRAAQVYLEQGCSWGEKGANTVIQEILGQIDEEGVMYRIKEELL
ncbi:GTP-binding protein [filamentous cyanobacterium LEGE 11480]|uniref:GTP-binding protein n=2 Tax=Romeriopsis TaxID=2992131 RepID=A0A928VLL2_9CYAN|nr:GTP-binding protein [Romeriopsis navalis LEGE 11480]